MRPASCVLRPASCVLQPVRSNPDIIRFRLSASVKFATPVRSKYLQHGATPHHSTPSPTPTPQTTCPLALPYRHNRQPPLSPPEDHLRRCLTASALPTTSTMRPINYVVCPHHPQHPASLVPRYRLDHAQP
jgi:hypothetical protein